MLASRPLRLIGTNLLRRRSFVQLGLKAAAASLSSMRARTLSPFSMSFSTAAEEQSQIEETYQKLTQREHILKRPDSYIGSVVTTSQDMWIFDDATNSMKYKKVKYNPGFLKIFDEILVNAIDNKQRCPEMTTIKVSVDPKENTISIFNDGDGIPVVMHQEYNMYVPSLIFGQLLSGTNFNDDSKKVTGGRNGYGAKLTNIYSTEFRVETVSNEKRFVQVFRDHMSVEDPAKITKASKAKQYTRITFKPDLSLFGMTQIDEDTLAVLRRRVIDTAGITDASVKVFWNEERVPVRDFHEYVKLFNRTIQNSDLAGNVAPDQRVDSQAVFGSSPRWEFAAIATPSSDFLPFSIGFVNGVWTSRGGKHLAALSDQIISRVQPLLERRLKRPVKPSILRDHLCLFCNCLIDNPRFDSQTKEFLSTPSRDFGSIPAVSDVFAAKLERGLVGIVADAMRINDEKTLKKSSGVKAARLLDIPKLDDANNAGTKRSEEATLIITEGDSAKALAVGGLGVVGRDNYGVFPLKGKVLNVRDVSEKQCAENEEIQSLVRILGLKYGKEYKDTSSLRYGHLLIMTDQDYDGSHIKGLVLNLFQRYWPSLLRLNYVSQFITPIVKVSGKGQERMFYTMKEFQDWMRLEGNPNAWRIKYYKGLGTSTAKEGKEYFSHIDKHVIPFAAISPREEDMLDMCFRRSRVEERKSWMNGFDPATSMDYSTSPISIQDFLNKELIVFSRQDCVRSIPSMVDGLKPSQRKVLHGCLKRRLTKEIKVVQLSGYISESVLYHHGEQSLNETIISMAQDFVGANNMNLLVPNGQFGTRIMGGKDSASPRYIYTYLHPVAQLVFRGEDEDLLTPQEEEGVSIEPETFLPILPTILVNGARGIGTGWSTRVLNHNPIEIADKLVDRLEGRPTTAIHPWFRGFTGTLAKEGNVSHFPAHHQTYISRGNLKWVGDDTIEITELPIGRWTQEYKQFLCELLQQGRLISGFKENHTDTEVRFSLSVREEDREMLRGDVERCVKELRLSSVMSVNNYFLFNSEGRIQHYSGAEEIMDEFIAYRLPFYQKRREAMLKRLREEKEVLQNKSRFVQSVLDGELVLRNRPISKVKEDLEAKGLKKMGENAFDYLLAMPLSGLTAEKVQELNKQKEEAEVKEKQLQDKTSKEMWIEDLQEFRTKFLEMEAKRLAGLVVKNQAANGFTVDNYFKSQVVSELCVCLIKSMTCFTKNMISERLCVFFYKIETHFQIMNSLL